MRRSEGIEEILKALTKFQSEVKDPSRDANNPFFKSKYVTLDNLLKAVRPAMADNGLSFVQMPISLDGKIGCTTILIHESGEWIESEPFVMTLQKNDPQGAGSALTYARRYSLSAMLGVAWDDDDDGNKGSNNTITKLGKEVWRIAQLKGQDGQAMKKLVRSYGVSEFEDLSVQQAKEILSKVRAM